MPPNVLWRAGAVALAGVAISAVALGALKR
jgi:hypothetical protein